MQHDRSSSCTCTHLNFQAKSAAPKIDGANIGFSPCPSADPAMKTESALCGNSFNSRIVCELLTPARTGSWVYVGSQARSTLRKSLPVLISHRCQYYRSSYRLFLEISMSSLLTTGGSCDAYISQHTDKSETQRFFCVHAAKATTGCFAHLSICSKPRVCCGMNGCSRCVSV